MRMGGTWFFATFLSLLPAISSAEQSSSKAHETHNREQHEQRDSGEVEGGEAWFEEGKRNRFAVFVGYGWVPKGQSGAESEGTLVIPALGLDYERWIHPRFAVGWYNDFQLSTFVVEREGEHHEEEKFLEREYAIVTAVVGIFEVAERLAIYAGPGKEFEKNESFFVFKVGGEYEFPLPNLWSLSIGGSYDIRDLYDSWGFAISIGKRF